MSKGARSGYNSDELEEWESLEKELVGECEQEDSLESSSYTSPMSTVSVKDLRKSFENLTEHSDADEMGVPAETLLKLKRSRSAFKGRITRITNALDKALNESRLNRVTLRVKHEELKGYLEKYHDIDGKVSELFDQYDVEVEDSERKSDRDESDKYLDSISDLIIKYEEHVEAKEKQPASSADLVAAISESQGDQNGHVITCPSFDGASDQLDFKNWFNQFETMVNSGRPMTGKYKLISLRNHLTSSGLAFELIKDMDLEDENYKNAVDALKAEFLDEEKMINNSFKRILEKAPQYDAQFQGLRKYVAEIKGTISDLKTSHNVDLTIPESGGYKFLSHVIF